MKKHVQIFNSVGSFAFCRTDCLEIKRGSEVIKESFNLSIDQFYSEPHNKHNGFIDTSPRHYDDASFASHIGSSVNEPNSPKDMSDADRFDICPNRHLQSPAELHALASLRPRQSDFVEPSTESVQVDAPAESA